MAFGRSGTVHMCVHTATLESRRHGAIETYMQTLSKPLLSAATPSAHPPLLCHAVLACTQLLSCLGLVYVRTAMDAASTSFDSVAFIFWRFAGATPLLLVAASATVGLRRPSLADARSFLALGLFLVCNQLFANLGVLLAGALIAACMQPFAPVLGAALATAVGQERFSVRIAVGLAVAVSGAVVSAAGRVDGDSGRASGGAIVAGMLCLVVHNFGWAAYVTTIVGIKATVARHGSLAVTGMAQLAGLLIMAGVVLVRRACTHSAPGLELPPAARLPLAYWIVVVSVLCYSLTAWASRSLCASVVTSYCTLQPAAGAALSVLLLGEQLRWSDCGAVGIVVGLFIVVRRPPAKPG